MEKNIFVLKTVFDVDGDLWPFGTFINIDDTENPEMVRVTRLEEPYPSTELDKDTLEKMVAIVTEDSHEAANKAFAEYEDTFADDYRILILCEDYQIRDEIWPIGLYVIAYATDEKITKLICMARDYPEILIEDNTVVPELRQLSGEDEINAGAYYYNEYLKSIGSEVEDLSIEDKEFKKLADEGLREDIILALCKNGEMVIFDSGSINTELTAEGIKNVADELIRILS